MYSPQVDLDREARKLSVLVPIRVELETETHRIRDAFMWNLNEELITPQLFARAFCNDLDIKGDHYTDQVVGAIRAQIEEHSGVAALDLRASLMKPDGSVDYYGEEPGEPIPDCRVILSVSWRLSIFNF